MARVARGNGWWLRSISPVSIESVANSGNFGGGGVFGDRDDLNGLNGRRGASSLSIGRFVPGVNPVLVEMGQQGQAETRRAELHRMLVTEMITRLGMT